MNFKIGPLSRSFLKLGGRPGLLLWYSPGIIGVWVFQPPLYVSVKWVPQQANQILPPPPPRHNRPRPRKLLRVLLRVVAFHLGLMYLCLHFLIFLCIGTWIIYKRRVYHMLLRHCNQNWPLSSLKIVWRTKSKSYEGVLLCSWYCRNLFLSVLILKVIWWNVAKNAHHIHILS